MAKTKNLNSSPAPQTAATPSRPKVRIKLTPMSTEKSELLALACKEWNQYMMAGKRLYTYYWKKTKKPNRKAYWSFSLISRKRYMNKRAKARSVHHRLANLAMWAGMYGSPMYTPRNAFFVPEEMITTDGQHIWLRLFPLTDLGFEFWGPAPKQVRVFRTRRTGDEWFIDFLV